MNERIEAIKREICKVVVGKDRIVEKVMTAMIAGRTYIAGGYTRRGKDDAGAGFQQDYGS